MLKPTHEVDSNSYTTDLAGHFMEKEIFEQPRAVKDALEGRANQQREQEKAYLVLDLKKKSKTLRIYK